jgi:hypothetical protein
MSIKKIVLYAIAFLALLSVASCVFGAEVADVPQAPNQLQAPGESLGRLADLDKETIFGGQKRGDKGLKKLDKPDFRLPSPFGITRKLISFGIQLLWFLIQLAIIALVVWVIVRAVKRTQDTGSPVPSKGEETVFDIFDRAVSDLKARRTDAAKVVDEADKRLPISTAEKETA